jgi:DNA-binding NarL/FixJ family response regulator
VKEEYKILLVDDHQIFREGLSFVISQMDGFKVVGEASDGKSFLKMIDVMDIDIVLMDISMPGIDGITATEKALRKHSKLKIIALTMFCDEAYYFRMIQAGVSGYILKDSGRDELIKALNAVVTGENYFSQKLLHDIILKSAHGKGPKERISSNDLKFTSRETEILKLICQGLSNAQISEKLSLSLRTVDSHRTGLMSKTGSRNSINLAVFALKNNLIEN